MALSPDEKFIYVNPDTTTGEYNLAQYFPVKHIRGLECANAANFYVYFRGPKDATSTRLTVSLTSGFIKEFFTQFVDEINFGEKSVITLADRNIAVDATTGGTDFVHVNAFVSPVINSDALTAGYEDLQVAEDLDVGGDTVISGSLTLDSVALSAVQTSAESFVDNDTSVMTSAAIDDRINTAVATTVGSAVDLTSEVSGTLPVANGGTGATSLTTDGILFGNGTSAISAVDLSSNGNIIVGGSTPAAVAGADLAGSGLAATTGNGTLVLAVETLNQNTTGSAATLTTPRAINGVDFDGSAAITVTAAGSTLSDTVTVAKGGTGLTTVAANTILTGNGTSALTAEANLFFASNRLTIGDNTADIQPYIRMFNDENTLELGVANGTNDFVVGSADGDVVLNSFGDHNVIIGQNDLPALTVDTNGDSNFNRRFTVTGDTDGTYEGDVVYFGGTTSMSVGKIYHYKSDGTWEAADADAVATSDGLLGVALGAASDTNGMLLRGMVTLDHDPGAVGDVLYLSTSHGSATSTAPSGNNDIVRVIGYCLHASNGQIWFNPDSTFVEVTA
jgi:hypothetical protein